MDSGVMSSMMMGIVVIGLGLSIYQLIAEVAAGARRAALMASRHETIRQLYSGQGGV